MNRTGLNIFKVISLSLGLLGLVMGYLIWNATKPPVYGGDFSLTYRGQSWKFSDDPKKLNLVYFGYAKCPDVCPLTLSFAGAAFAKLSAEEQKNVRLIFVSVDHEHDNPNDVADYATNFFPQFLGLSGSQEEIDGAIRLFPATYIVEKNPKSYLGYSIIHTDKIFFLDKNGKSLDDVMSPRDADTVYEKLKEHL